MKDTENLIDNQEKCALLKYFNRERLSRKRVAIWMKKYEIGPTTTTDISTVFYDTS
jgi:hypothetical protein